MKWENTYESVATTFERDELIELVELAEEAALSELAAFGCIEFENDERDVVGDELEGFWEFADVTPWYIPFELM